MQNNLKKEKRDIRMVFLTFSTIFSVFAWRNYPSVSSYILIGLVFVIMFLAVFSPNFLRPIFKLWLKVVHAVGRFNTQILLSITFVLIFIPIGLIMRILRKDPMKKRMSAEISYWESYELVGLKDKGRYKRQY